MSDIMCVKPRFSPTEISSEFTDSHTVQTRYEAGYGVFTVKSLFAGDKPLSEIFYEIIQRKIESPKMI